MSRQGTSEEKLLTLPEWAEKGHPESFAVETRNASLPSSDGALFRILDGLISKGGIPELGMEPPPCQACVGIREAWGTRRMQALPWGAHDEGGRPSQMGPGVLSWVGSCQRKTDARSRPGT